MPIWLWQFSAFFVVIFVLIATALVAGIRLVRLSVERDAFQREKSPPPPENIVVHLTNGTDVAVDAVLSPMRTWIVTRPFTPDEVEDISVGKMPPFTEIGFRTPS